MTTIITKKNIKWLPMGVIFSLLACSNEEKSSSEKKEESYATKANDDLCNCYQEEHEKKGIDYNKSMIDFEDYLKSNLPAFKRVDTASYKAFLDYLILNNGYENHDINLARSYEPSIRLDLLRTCLFDNEQPEIIKSTIAHFDKIVRESFSDLQRESVLQNLKVLISTTPSYDTWLDPFLMHSAYTIHLQELILFQAKDSVVYAAPPPPPPPPAKTIPKPQEVIITEGD